MRRKACGRRGLARRVRNGTGVPVRADACAPRDVLHLGTRHGTVPCRSGLRLFLFAKNEGGGEGAPRRREPPGGASLPPLFFVPSGQWLDRVLKTNLYSRAPVCGTSGGVVAPRLCGGPPGAGGAGARRPPSGSAAAR